MNRYITDMGEPIVATASETGEQLNIGRYGVWDTVGRRKPEVIACGDDLDALQAEYGPCRVLHVFSPNEIDQP